MLHLAPSSPSPDPTVRLEGASTTPRKAVARRRRHGSSALRLVPLALTLGCVGDGDVRSLEEVYDEAPTIMLDAQVSSEEHILRICPEGALVRELDSGEFTVTATGRGMARDTLILDVTLAASQDSAKSAVGTPGAPPAQVSFLVYPNLGLGEACKDGLRVRVSSENGTAMEVDWVVRAKIVGSAEDIPTTMLVFTLD